MINLILGDCLEVMKDIPDKSVDMVLCDPPYGTTACKWDSVIPFEPMWQQLKRIVKDNAGILLFGSQPFTSKLVSSNISDFRHEWIWQKARPGNFSVAKFQPMKDHEIISVFGKKAPRYFPIKEERKGSGSSRIMAPYKPSVGSQTVGFKQSICTTGGEALRFPSSIQYFNNVEGGERYHPTQKPASLLEYLIKTYTLPSEMVLDFTMGSGSTGVAAKQLGRSFIGIEREPDYFEIAKRRIENAVETKEVKQEDPQMEFPA